MKQFIILGAGRPSQALMPIFGITSSLMIPVAGKPVLQHTLEALTGYAPDLIVIVANAKDCKLINFIRHALHYEAKIVLVDDEEQTGPGGSLLQGLGAIDLTQPAMILLGDTIFELKAGSLDFGPRKNVIWVDDVPDAARWTFCRTEADHRVTDVVDFPQEKPAGMKAIFGPYYLDDPSLAYEALKKRTTPARDRLEISAALQPYIERGILFAENLETSLDCGHLDFLLSSRRRILAARSFNQIQVDELRGVIEKRSDHGDKFRNEISFYLGLPKDVQPFFPRIFDYSLQDKDAFVRMEFYPFPTLSEIWCYEEFEAPFWVSVADKLLGVIGCFKSHPGEVDAATVQYVYWGKTVERLAQFARQGPAAARLTGADTVVVNGRRIANFHLRPELERKVMAVAASIRPTLMHGDLCFSNILFEAAGRTVRLIDPRGGFKDASLFGDFRYDLAKIIHSIHGGYDSIIHDLFELKWHGAEIELNLYHNRARQVTLDYLRDRIGETLMSEILLIESLLFFSMTPLHQDYPKRQAAMYAVALQILDQALES